uniref:Prolamin-like domain-containing protein n=1 Tax=Kalanchoe fedtschenkoi TaxID=63787 RepID=A0A7N0RG62_KALFE
MAPGVTTSQKALSTILIVTLCMAAFSVETSEAAPKWWKKGKEWWKGWFGDAAKCISAFSSVPGCYAEMAKSAVTGDLSHVGKDCCKLAVSVTDDCLSWVNKNFYSRAVLLGTDCDAIVKS